MSVGVGHVAVGRSSEEAADRFYGELLGFEKTRCRDLPPDLSEPLFGRRDGCRMIDYVRDGTRIEVFVPEGALARSETYGHVCLVVDDREALLARAATLGVEVLEVGGPSRRVVFLRDGDGNLYEIQQAP